MSSAPLRFGALGASNITPLALVDPASRLDGAEVVTVAAREGDRAREYAKERGIPEADESYQAVIDRDDLDAIYVALPANAHHEWTLKALAAGKHVLCEKPIGLNARQAAEVVAAADEAGRVLFEAFHYQLHPLTKRFVELANDGTIGELQKLDAWFRAPAGGPRTGVYGDATLGAGTALHMGCYPIHLSRLVGGGEPEKVSAVVTTDGDLETSIDAELGFASGVTARAVSTTTEDPPRFTIGATATGTDGSIHMGNFITPQMAPTPTITIRIGGGDERAETFEDAETTYWYQLDAFVKAVHGTPAPAFTGPAAIANMALIDRIYAEGGYTYFADR